MVLAIRQSGRRGDRLVLHLRERPRHLRPAAAAARRHGPLGRLALDHQRYGPEARRAGAVRHLRRGGLCRGRERRRPHLRQALPRSLQAHRTTNPPGPTTPSRCWPRPSTRPARTTRRRCARPSWRSRGPGRRRHLRLRQERRRPARLQHRAERQGQDRLRQAHRLARAEAARAPRQASRHLRSSRFAPGTSPLQQDRDGSGEIIWRGNACRTAWTSSRNSSSRGSASGRSTPWWRSASC